MKHLKKVLALVIAMVMVMAMGATVFAEGEDTPVPTAAPAYDHPLKVTGLAKDDQAHFYQVLEWVGEADGNVAGWKAKDPFDSVLTKEELTKMLVGTPASEGVEAVAATGMTAELAGKLARAAVGDGTVVKVTGTEAELNNPAAGMYMALITPADADTVYNPVFVSADFDKSKGDSTAITSGYADEAAAKKSTLELTKTAETTEDNWDDKKSNTTAVGDTVTFTVNTTIPAYGTVYEHPHFVMKDTLTALKLNKDSVTVKDLNKGEDYTVDATDSGYTITFTENFLKKQAAPLPIEVTYSAIVTSDASKAVNEEDNEVSIEYSHNPNDEDDYDVKKDTTQHYTFSLDAEGVGEGETVSGKKTSELVKIGVDAQGNPITQTEETSEITNTEKWKGSLEGAVFGLFTDEAGTVPYKAKKADGTEGDAVTATTGSDGRMNFKGLDAGTYYLKEISAPAGYVTSSTVTKVEIKAEFDTVKVTEWWNGSKFVSTKPTSGTAKEVTYETEILKKYEVIVGGVQTATYTFTNKKETNSTDIQWENAELVEKPYKFENKKGAELPSTGGVGTTMFYIIGSILVLGAGILLVTRRRMSVQ